jgi:tetratricopeptide (TPR) repeat protein
VNLSRASWLIVVAAIAVTAAVPSLRSLARRQFHAFPRRPTDEQTMALSVMTLFTRGGMESPASYGWLWHMQGAKTDIGYRALPFALEQRPEKPELWAAAAQLAAGQARDLERAGKGEEAEALRAQAMAVFRRAAERADSPACWAGYAVHLLQPLECNRIGESGVDPGDPEAVALERQRLEEGGFLEGDDSVSKQPSPQAEEALEALRSWARVDPDNAVPVALRAWVLYGLRRDGEAVVLVSELTNLSVATDRAGERAQALRDLLNGLDPSPVGTSVSESDLRGYPSTMGRLRSIARIMSYEGRRAQLEGRQEEAVALWDSGFRLGQLLCESADTTIEYLVGSAVEGIAIHPVWSWRLDSRTGSSGGPLMGGRLWYGPHYEFYVAVAGLEAAEELRDTYTTTKLRTAMIGAHFEQSRQYERSVLVGYYAFIGQVIAAIALSLLLLSATIGLLGRRYEMSDEWTRHLRRLRAWLLGLIGAAIAWAIVGAWLAPEAPIYPWLPFSLFAPAVVLVFLGSFLFSLLAWGSRRPFWATWGVSVRHTVPPLLALLAIAYLVTSVLSLHYWRQLTEPTSQPEMERLTAWAGPDWHNPPVPPDAWVAEHPPPFEPR